MTPSNPIGPKDMDPLKMDLAKIDLSKIDLSDQTYWITRAGEDIPALALSISQLGICTPPAVIQTESGSGQSFAVVSGFRRIRAALSLNMAEAVCRVFKNSDQQVCSVLAVVENAHARDLGPGELVRAVRLLYRHMDAKIIAGRSQSLFNTRLNAGYVTTLLRISDLGQQALDLLDQGLLAVKTAKMLTELSPADAQAFIGLFSQIKASTGKQMEMLTWTREITAREGGEIEGILLEEDLRTALDTDQGNRDTGAAANRVRAWLYARRFPELDRTRKRSAELVRDLKLPANIRMALPDNFESMVYSLTLSITSLEDLDKGLETLSGLKTHPSLKQILDR